MDERLSKASLDWPAALIQWRDGLFWEEASERRLACGGQKGEKGEGRRGASRRAPLVQGGAQGGTWVGGRLPLQGWPREGEIETPAALPGVKRRSGRGTECECGC